MTTRTSSRKSPRALAWLAAVAIVAVSADAWGQTSNGSQWRRGTTLAGFAGVEAPDARGAAGTALGWEIIPHLTLEGRGVWFAEGGGSSDFFAWLGALVPLRPAGAVVPFASAGIGMYRATVEAGAVDVPEFYQRRMGTRARAVFDDVAPAFGGGADVFLTSHVAIRPEVNVILVATQGETRTVALYGVQVAYHFEPHKTR